MPRAIEDIIEDVCKLDEKLGEELNLRLHLFAVELEAKQRKTQELLDQVFAELRNTGIR